MLNMTINKQILHYILTFARTIAHCPLGAQEPAYVKKAICFHKSRQGSFVSRYGGNKVKYY